MVAHPELITEQVHNRQQELKNQGDNLDSEIAQKRRQIATIEQDRMTYTRQLGRGKITESVYDALMAECDENEADYKEQLDHLLTLRDDQRKVRTAIAYAERLLANIRQKLPEINQTPEELAALPEDKRRAIMLERQTVIRSLCDKVIVYADGNITIKGLIEVEYITSITHNQDMCH
jgi:chromosome segregation ATPase